MKKTIVGVSFVSLALLAGCSMPAANTTTNTTGAETVAQEKPVPNSVGSDVKVANNQKVIRQGEKVGGVHTGTVDILPESTLTISSDNKLLGGTVIIRMSTISDSDTTDAASNAKLVEHLKSADFFDVANHPTALIVTKRVTDTTITADLTIRGITKEITFPITLTQDGDGLLLSAKLDIVLKDFNVGQTLLGKVALKDTFTITLDKVAFLR